MDDRDPKGSQSRMNHSSARFTERDAEFGGGWGALFKAPRVEHKDTQREAVRLAAGPVIGGLIIGLVIFEVSLLIYYGTVWKASTKGFEVLIVQSDPGIVVPALTDLPAAVQQAFLVLNTSYYQHNRTLPLLSNLPVSSILQLANLTGVSLQQVLSTLIGKVSMLLGSVAIPIGNTSYTVSLGEIVTSAIQSFRNPTDGNPLGQITVLRTPGIEHLHHCRNSVREEKYWVCLQIPANFTLTWLQALVSYPNRSVYDNGIDAYFNQGHHPSTNTVIENAYKMLLTGINSAFALKVATGIGFLQYPLNLITPSALISPIFLNVHDEFVSLNAANYFIAVFLVLGWGSMVSSIAVLHASTIKLFLYFAPAWISFTRIIVVFVFAVFLSLQWTITIYCFGPEVASNFGAIWWWGFYSLSTFAAVIFFVTGLLGPFAAVILTPLMILMLNLSNGYFDTVLCHSDFYRWGVALPWFHAYQGFRTLFFGTPGSARLAFNGGILAIWFFSFSVMSWLIFMMRTVERVSKWSGPDTPIGRTLAGFHLSTVATNTSVLAGGFGVGVAAV